MENFFSRYRNETILVAILFIQVIALATQVRVPSANATAVEPGGGTRLIRVWAVSMVVPFQKLFVYSGSGFRKIPGPRSSGSTAQPR